MLHIPHMRFTSHSPLHTDVHSCLSLYLQVLCTGAGVGGPMSLAADDGFGGDDPPDDGHDASFIAQVLNKMFRRGPAVENNEEAAAASGAAAREPIPVPEHDDWNAGGAEPPFTGRFQLFNFHNMQHLMGLCFSNGDRKPYMRQ